MKSLYQWVGVYLLGLGEKCIQKARSERLQELRTLAERAAEAPIWVYDRCSNSPTKVYLSRVRWQPNGVGLYIEQPPFNPYEHNLPNGTR